MGFANTVHPGHTLSRTQRITAPSSSKTAAAACCSGTTCRAWIRTSVGTARRMAAGGRNHLKRQADACTDARVGAESCCRDMKVITHRTFGLGTRSSGSLRSSFWCGSLELPYSACRGSPRGHPLVCTAHRLMGPAVMFIHTSDPGYFDWLHTYIVRRPLGLFWE